MTGVEWGVIIVGTLGGLSGAAALLQAFFGRGKTRADKDKANADAAGVITSTAMEWIDKFERQAEAAQETARQAQQTAVQAEQKTREMQAQMDAVTREARAVADMLADLRTAILAPGATVDGLRALVSQSGRHG